MARAPTLEYAERFSLPAAPDAVWSTVARTDAFESWWSWLRELKVDGTPLESGCVLHGLVAPPVPYRMRLHVALERCVRPNLIEADVSGDLVGRAGIRFDPERDGTRATVSWSVEMMQGPMRLAARVGSPVLRFAHDRVVEHTVSRFVNQLVLQGTARGRPTTGMSDRLAEGDLQKAVTLTRVRVVNEQR